MERTETKYLNSEGEPIRSILEALRLLIPVEGDRTIRFFKYEYSETKASIGVAFLTLKGGLHHYDFYHMCPQLVNVLCNTSWVELSSNWSSDCFCISKEGKEAYRRLSMEKVWSTDEVRSLVIRVLSEMAPCDSSLAGEIVDRYLPSSK